MATTPIRTFYLDKEYGVAWNRDNTLQALGYTYATAKAKFGALIPWLESLGWSQAEVLGLYEFCAAWNDAFWRGNGYFSESPIYSNITGTRCNIIAPHGAYRLNFPCLVNQGTYEGQGAGEYSGSPNQSTGGTGLYIDHSTWMNTRAPERFCLKSANWGTDTYTECCTIKGFRFEGGRTNMIHDPSFVSAGVGMFDSGEASSIQSCYAFGFNTDGFMTVRGTPGSFAWCSSFSNGRYGFGMIGNDLSTTTFIGCSGDDNNFLYGVESGFGRPGGGTTTVLGNKSESGKRTPSRKQGLFKGVGAVNFICNGASLDSTDGTTTAVEVDFQTYNGQVDISGIRQNGIPNALKLTAKGVTKTYLSPGNITPYSYVATEAGLIWSSRTLPISGSTTPPVDPPVQPPPGTKFSGGPYVMNTGTFKVDLTASPVAGVTQVVLTNLKCSSLAWGRILGTGSGKPSLQIGTDGYFYFAGSKVAGSPKVTVNVAGTYTLTIPSSTITCLFQTDPNQGGAQMGTLEKLELK